MKYYALWLLGSVLIEYPMAPTQTIRKFAHPNCDGSTIISYRQGTTTVYECKHDKASSVIFLSAWPENMDAVAQALTEDPRTTYNTLEKSYRHQVSGGSLKTSRY